MQNGRVRFAHNYFCIHIYITILYRYVYIYTQLDVLGVLNPFHLGASHIFWNQILIQKHGQPDQPDSLSQNHQVLDGNIMKHLRLCACRLPSVYMGYTWGIRRIPPKSGIPRVTELTNHHIILFCKW